jgi:sulfite reductase beta subunit
MPGIGIPPFEANLPPILKRNYGKWTSHEHPRAGVIKHDSESGEACFTVRFGMPPNARISTQTLRLICDLAEEFAEGYFRVTQRNSCEFVGVPEQRIEELIARLAKMGFPVGGTNRSLHNTVCCTGYMHCHLAATDPAAIMKAISEMLLKEFQNDCLPAKLKISGSGCVNNCGEASTADIGIVGVHRDLPPIKEDKLKGCELPLVISVCPVGAIKPKGPGMLEIDPKRCVHCPACSVACAAMAPIGSADGDGVAIVVGGKASNTGAGPAIARLVVPYLPNHPPYWPEVTSTVRKIVDVWSANARKDERVGDWIARIGWPKFFERTGLPVSSKVVDGYDARSLEYAKANVRFNW